MNKQAKEREYLLGTRDEELVRLGFQHGVWSEVAARGWERAGFAPGQTLLDVGCGPGYATLDLAYLVGGEGRVIGVDQSQRFISHLEAQSRARGLRNVSALVADVTRLDLEERSIDGAYTRWVLCYLEDPAAVIESVARVLRPRGTFVVQDYLHYVGITLAPPSDAFARVIPRVVESWRLHGGDLDVGMRLPRMMAHSGLEVAAVNPIVRLARPGSALWQWPEGFFWSYLPRLVEWELITEDEAEAFRRDWRTRSEDPAAFFLTPPMVEVIARKPD